MSLQAEMQKKLSVTDHSRDVAGLKYIYPVISRRARGLSIGINVNINNACNWRCVYCQVPDLQRGSAPEINWRLLQEELQFFLAQVLDGDFYEQYAVPQEMRDIKDIAISGNGEPTSVRDFQRLPEIIAQCLADLTIKERPEIVLITNGSLIHRPNVSKALSLLHALHGKVWFKLDFADAQSRVDYNGAAISQQRYIANLVSSASLCETWVQTCVFNIAGQVWPEQHWEDYVLILQEVTKQVAIKGVLLYTLARPSLQPEASALKPCSEQEMNVIANKIRSLGILVQVAL